MVNMVGTRNCRINGSSWISIKGDHYAVWERELDQDEISTGIVHDVNGMLDHARLRCCFRLCKATVTLHCQDETEIVLIEDGSVKTAGVGIVPVAATTVSQGHAHPILRLVECYSNDAWAGCDNEKSFESEKLALHVENLMVDGEFVDVISSLSYDGNELQLENYDEQTELYNSYKSILYQDQCFSLDEGGRLPAELVPRLREDELLSM